MKKLVICTGAKRGKCKNKKCIHHQPHRPDVHEGRVYCTRFGYCRNFPASRDKRPVAWPKAIEVKCE